MSGGDEIEAPIRSLPEEDSAAPRGRPAELDAAAWNRQFERDVAEGRLDFLAEEAIRDLRERRGTDP